jgi:long-subunit fatty acid transport protein
MASLNYLAVAYPFSFLNRNIVVSINYQRILDFDRDLELGEVHSKQRGSLDAISPALCVQVTSRVSVGLAINIWVDDIFSGRAWESWESNTSTSSKDLKRYEQFSGFFGVNATIGMLWRVWQGLQAGAVVKTPFRATVDWECSGMDCPESSEELKVDFPWAYGIGAAYRIADRWCVSLDVTRIHWDDYVILRTDPETGSDIEISPWSTGKADVGATTTVRAGMEYLFIRHRYVIPIRGGVFYDPLPARDDTDEYFGFSLGSGVALEKLSFDLAYTIRFRDLLLLGRPLIQYRDDVPGDPLSGVADTKADVVSHQFLFSVIYYF